MSVLPRTPASLAVRWALGGFGCVLIANGAWLAATSNRNLGMALVIAAGALFVAWALAWRRVWARRWVGAAASALVVSVVALSAFLGVVGARDTVTYDEDAVIVLGAAVHGSEISPTLQRRLDAALAYRARNPGALIVVSGGRGDGEDVTEASAMRDYLVGRGVAEASIVTEDRSTSTDENFAFSKAILDARLHPGYRIAFVTSDFHVYRAGRLAASAGLNARSAHAPTPWYFWPTNYLREDLAVIASWAGR